MNIEKIKNKAKRGAGYRWMQNTILSLCDRVTELDKDLEEAAKDYMTLGQDYGTALDQIDELEREIEEVKNNG